MLNRPAIGLWAVADGVGGHQHGAWASRLAAERLGALELAGSLDARVHSVEHCLREINEQLVDTARHLPRGPRTVIASTIVVLVIAGDRAACLWAGDSRCYLWRGQELFQLSQDHHAPGTRSITRALGAAAQLDLSTVLLPVQTGDRLLLCSDGLYRENECAELCHALSLPLATMALDRLFSRALAGRAADNLSGVVVRT